MANEQMRASIFGPSPQEVSNARQDQNNATAMEWARMPAGRGVVAGAARAGSALGGVVGNALGGQDPAIAKAQAMQEAQQEVQQSGVSLLSNPTAYYEAAYNAMAKRGLMDEANNVRNILLQENAQQAEVDKLNAEARKADREGYKGFGASGNMVYNKDTGDAQVMEGYQGKEAAPAEIQKLIAQLRDPDLSEEERGLVQARIDKLNSFAPPNNLNVSLKGEGKFLETVGKGTGEEVVAERSAAITAADIFNRAANINETLDNGDLIIGPGADFRLAAAKAFNVLGANNDETIANTQRLVADLSNNTLDSIKTSGLGTGQGFTAKDLTFLNQARSGDISFNDDTLRYIADINNRVAAATIRKWNNTLSSFDSEQREGLRLAGVNINPVKIPEYKPYNPKWKPSKSKKTATSKPSSFPGNDTEWEEVVKQGDAAIWQPN